MQNFYTPNFFSSPTKIGVHPALLRDDKENRIDQNNRPRAQDYFTLGQPATCKDLFQAKGRNVLQEVPLDTSKKQMISHILFPEETPSARLYPIKDFHQYISHLTQPTARATTILKIKEYNDPSDVDHSEIQDEYETNPVANHFENIINKEDHMPIKSREEQLPDKILRESALKYTASPRRQEMYVSSEVDVFIYNNIQQFEEQNESHANVYDKIKENQLRTTLDINDGAILMKIQLNDFVRIDYEVAFDRIRELQEIEELCILQIRYNKTQGQPDNLVIIRFQDEMQIVEMATLITNKKREIAQQRQEHEKQKEREQQQEQERQEQKEKEIMSKVIDQQLQEEQKKVQQESHKYLQISEPIKNSEGHYLSFNQDFQAHSFDTIQKDKISHQTQVLTQDIAQLQKQMNGSTLQFSSIAMNTSNPAPEQNHLDSSIISDVSAIDHRKNKKYSLVQEIQQANTIYTKLQTLLYKEFKVIKYGRNNIFGGQVRYLCFDRSLDRMIYKAQPTGKRLKTFLVQDLLSVQPGRNTPNFKRFKTKDQLKLKQSFSIMMAERSIDLECPGDQKQVLYKALRNLIKVRAKYKIEKGQVLGRQ